MSTNHRATGPGRPGQGPPGLVIFDCDGVLVDTEPTTLRVMTEWIRVCGLEVTREEVTARYKGTDIAVIEADVVRRLGSPLDPAFGDFTEGYRSRMFAAFEAGVEPVRGAVAVLDALNDAGVPWCVASNGPREKMAVSLKAAGLARYFGDEGKGVADSPERSRRVYSAYDINEWKPEPGLFLHACRAMGGSVETSVVIEDSTSGIVAAKAGGFRCIGVAEITAAGELRDAGADEVIGSMTELPPLLDLTPDPAAPEPRA